MPRPKKIVPTVVTKLPEEVVEDYRANPTGIITVKETPPANPLASALSNLLVILEMDQDFLKDDHTPDTVNKRKAALYDAIRALEMTAKTT